MFVLEVIESIATFSLTTRLKVSQEVIIGSITTTHFLYSDELLIFDEEHTITVAKREIILHEYDVFSILLTFCSS